uniref:LPAT n=1 Tax=Arundo donax TaxID=35708 RepID=A0A0A9D1S8_ARUDO
MPWKHTSYHEEIFKVPPIPCGLQNTSFWREAGQRMKRQMGSQKVEGLPQIILACPFC